MEYSSMLIFVGCLAYTVCNILLFTFFYVRRRYIVRNTRDAPERLFHNLQVVPLPQSLTHNTWLHEVAMRKLCVSSKLVGVQSLSSNGNGGHLQEGDIILRIRNIFGPFTDLKVLNRIIHENRKFQSQMLVYRYDPEAAKTTILDISGIPSQFLANTALGYVDVRICPTVLSALHSPNTHREGVLELALDCANSVTTPRREGSVSADLDDAVCGICLENLPNATIDPCGHKICVDCHNLLIRKSCPYCRCPIDKCTYELLI